MIDKQKIERRKCAHCGRLYQPRKTDQKFCSPPCKQGDQSLRKQERERETAIKLREGLKCLQCGAPVPLNREKYCSQECLKLRWYYTHPKPKEPPKPRAFNPCALCGKDVDRGYKAKYCFECSPSKPKLDKDRARIRTLRKYGVTPEEWDTMFEAQGKCCAICGTDEPGSKNWHTDHLHNGIPNIRAILCSPCNLGLGAAKDSPELLDKMAAYIRFHAAKHTASSHIP